MTAWLARSCTYCQAQSGHQCSTANGVPLVYPHTERVEGADSRGVCPECLSSERLDREGRIGAHDQVRASRRTEVPCPGGGSMPELAW